MAKEESIYEYSCPKKEYDIKDVYGAQLFFRNGDYIELQKEEIIDVSLQFYDTLVAGEKGFCPVAKSGYIKCKLKEKRTKYDRALLYNEKEFRKDKKQCLENRFLNEGGLFYVRLFNEYCWHMGIYGDIVASKDGEYLLFSFKENETYGTFDDGYHKVKAPNITRKAVEKITLDFENCDGFEIFQEEIIDVQLTFERELTWTSSCYGREIRGGYIRLKLDKELTWRWVNVYNCDERPLKIKKLERRLCGKGFDDMDICHLYITYRYAGYAMKRVECLDTKQIFPQNITPQNGDIDDEFDDEIPYVSGYAKKEKNGTILIVFGKEKEK